MSLRQAHLKDTKAPLMTGENPATHIFQKFHVISSSIWKSFGFKTQQLLKRSILPELNGPDIILKDTFSNLYDARIGFN